MLCPSNTGVQLPGLSLVSLVLSLCPFKSDLKLFQCAPLTPEQKTFSPFETSFHIILFEFQTFTIFPSTLLEVSV